MRATNVVTVRACRALLCSVALVLLGACGGGGPQADEEGWMVYFNGTDLSNWTVVGDANWRVEEGAMVADQSSAFSYLVSDATFANFELELEFFVDGTANSGVFIRCANPTAIDETSCYEINIFDTRPDQRYRTGAIMNLASPARFIYTADQWNRYVISAKGNRIKVVLNDADMVDVEDSRLASGPIALQYGAGTVKFRNVRIRHRP